MATLSNPKLTIELISGTSDADVTASVKVGLDATEEALVKLVGLKFKLRCRLYGDDSGPGFNGDDDLVYAFATKTVHADGTYTFHRTISRDRLDEDWEGNDEIYAHFAIQSTSPIFQLNPPPTRNSDIIHGNF